ncbi:MAG: FIST C-terminal domain-containing protein, partial [Deltaproteobacteria bacterium]|nr:FIST C-terminal domain-containing protein [Deltaproteobacteria bacterium]
MIDMLIAHTLEVDDPSRALRETLALLDLSRRLKKNSVGIVHCSNDFIENGMVREICERMPFPTIGMNTLLHSSSLGLIDNILLTLCVLTSDDVRFSTALTEPLTPANMNSAIAYAYVDAENLLQRRPAFGFVIAPNLNFCAIGEEVIDILDRVSDRLPFFGGVAADYSVTIRNPKVIFNGESFSDRLALILTEGRVNPRFQCYPVPAIKLIQQKGIVTASEGNMIKTVNGRPVLEFLEDLGLSHSGHIAGTHTIPIFLDSHDGNPPRVRIMHGQTAEGYITLGGKVPVDTTLGIGAINQEHVEATLRHAGSLAKRHNPRVFILYSCLSRNFSLGLDYRAELETLRSQTDGKIPYVFNYTAGEFCPVHERGGRYKN